MTALKYTTTSSTLESTSLILGAVNCVKAIIAAHRGIMGEGGDASYLSSSDEAIFSLLALTEE